MGIPFIFILFIIFILVFQYKLKKSEKNARDARAHFWKQEEKSLFARKKSLDTLDYITINTEKLPLFSGDEHLSSEDQEIYKVQQQVLELAKEPMVNLSKQSNTDLRMTYGPSNLDTITMYENNYTKLVRLLYQWGSLLSSTSKTKEAIAVLECGLDAGTDISEHIILLGSLYLENNDIDHYRQLLEQVQASDSLLKNKILRTLKEKKESYS